jgi:Glycosyl hydrolase family 71
MTTYVDASYNQTLNGKPYLMPVSPLFFINLPGYNKNWLWRGDDLWYTRWQEVLYFQSEFVEIISWNDFGESHYMGPLDDTHYDAFNIGNAPYNYADSMPHNGWRDMLPFLIDTYKKGIASFSQEILIVWYRTSFAAACADGETTGNTTSQLQIEFPPAELVADKIFVSALITKSADCAVWIGGDEY